MEEGKNRRGVIISFWSCGITTGKAFLLPGNREMQQELTVFTVGLGDKQLHNSWSSSSRSGSSTMEEHKHQQ